MDDTKHFDLVRQRNRRFIRNLMRDYRQIGKAELAEASGLSFPTVSALVGDMIATGEVILLEETQTRGGRPAGQYALAPLFRAGICAYIADMVLCLRVVDIFGETVFERKLPFPAKDCSAALCDAIRYVKKRFPTLDAMSLGLPGVVRDGRVLFLPSHPELNGVDLHELLQQTFGIDVFLENDVNAFVLAERETWPSLFHFLRSEACSGSGILVDGKLMRGAGGYAGEIEYLDLPSSGTHRTLNERLALIASQYTGDEYRQAVNQLIAEVLVSVICILNPADVALSGFELDEADLSSIHDTITSRLPEERCPRIHTVSDVEPLYFAGLLSILCDYRKSQ